MKKEPRQLHPNRQKAGAHLAVVVTPSEDLRENERIIKEHLCSGLAAGAALARIHNDEQYKQEGFKSFEAYCKQRLDISRRHAYRLVDAAAVSESVSHGSQNLPPITVERHARELAKLPEPEQQAKAWAAAVEAAGESPVRATLVAKEVAKLLPPPPPKPEARKETAPATATTTPAAPARRTRASEEPPTPDDDEGEGGVEDPVVSEMLFRSEIERELDGVADRWFARCSERETLAQILINLADELRRRDASP